jgi:hypothetical protein
MRRGQPNINVAIYGKALVHLVRHPSILLVPLLAAVVDALVTYWQNIFTDPLGGMGTSIIQWLLQIIYMFAFGAAIVQANNIVRGYRGGFDASWEETRGKAVGILIAAIGFQFILWAAAFVGGLFGSAGQLALQIVAAFFLILTIPAAAIGGLPGQFALGGSIRAVRANWLACIPLAIVFVALWYFFTAFVSNEAAAYFGPFVRAVVLAYLAFPFAVTYDETAFRGRY